MKPIVKPAVTVGLLSIRLGGTALLSLQPANAAEIIIKGAPFREVVPFNRVVHRPYEAWVPGHFVPAHETWYGAFVPGHYVPGHRIFG